MAAEPVLSLRGFAVERVPAMRAEVPELALDPGGAAALLGPSGCGKTSVLRGLFRLDPGLGIRGEVHCLGDALPAGAGLRELLRNHVAIAPQDAPSAFDPLVRLGEQLAIASRRARVDVAQALADVGIAEPRLLMRRYPHQISGGQAQRCSLAAAMLRRPALLIADEPTAGLDDAIAKRVLDALAAVRRLHGTAVLVATHDHAVVRALAATPLHFTSGGVFVAGAPALPPWPSRERRAPTARAVLRCYGLGRRIGGRHWILRDLDLTLAAGEVVAVVGPSGAGKTTLAKLLAQHLRPTTGKVERPAPRAAVQLLFQDAFASLTPGVPVGALVREVAVPGFDLDATAAQLHLTSAHLARPAAALSGGERRRAALLRALAVRPEILILDEPTASLDRATAVGVVALLLAVLQTSGAACVLITHDVGLAEACADRMIRLERGRQVAVAG
ncbi:MAG: ATP-binding cassette domain-containing protein [Planctomycetota bacterium]